MKIYCFRILTLYTNIIYELMIVQTFAKGVVRQEISVIIKSFFLVSHKDFLYCLFNEFPVKLIFIKFCLSFEAFEVDYRDD